jgi:hypothetical protein
MSIRESRFGRLVEHFFAGFLDNDLLSSSEAGMQAALTQIIGLVAAPGCFYCLLALFKYAAVYYPEREVLTWPDKIMFISFSMILTGLLSVVEWDALFPDRRDYQVLVPLPITTRLLFAAKLSSVLFLLVIFWAAANLGPAVMFPAIVGAVSNSSFDYGRFVIGHVLATFAACSFVFLFFVGVQGILLNVLSPKWFRRVSVYIQLTAVLALVLLFLLLPLLLFSVATRVHGNDPWMYALPPFWFLGLYQELIGRGSPVFSPLAAVAVAAVVACAAVSALAYWLSYWRHMKRLLESLEPGRSGPGFIARVAEVVFNRFVLTHPLERGCFHFIRLTLLRSRVHRLLMAAYTGVGIALVLGGAAVVLRWSTGGRPVPSLLSVQLVLSFFVVSGMRFAFTVPAELRANWLFQAAEPSQTARCRSGVRRAMLTLAVCPVLLGLLPAHALLWGWRVAGAHLAYGLVLSVLLVELLLLNFEKIPFTCTYLPGKANVKGFWPLYLAAYWMYAHFMANIEYRLLDRPTGFALFLLTIAAATALLRWLRQRQLGPEFRFLFEDLPDPAVRTLDITH